jgi:hypothetical protein
LPPICFHLGIAEEAISRLRNPIVERDRGSFFLGCTAPDIRFFIGATREETHFFPLESEEELSGARLMFEAHPELGRDSEVNDATRSFVAGYLSHLVTDEAWIRRIYRPFFGKSSPLGGDAMANLLDRLLQFELDRRERLDCSDISAIREELVDPADVAVGFIDDFNLSKWRDFVRVVSGRKLTWEDFRTFAERYLVWIQQIAPEKLEDFFASFDARLDEVLAMVPEKTIQEFREQSIADSVSTAREYLG